MHVLYFKHVEINNIRAEIFLFPCRMFILHVDCVVVSLGIPITWLLDMVTRYI